MSDDKKPFDVVAAREFAADYKMLDRDPESVMRGLSKHLIRACDEIERLRKGTKLVEIKEIVAEAVRAFEVIDLESLRFREAAFVSDIVRSLYARLNP